ncbi:hypothetical protein [Thalassovita aquimarina]|uniref:Uncharacterized protein n=1 Tax=Thalassovita aquimarina TaxID=2785917 RepID=A0ABS5HX85_9RHOB|nr:hypothetical protein [Thalassovita aquimarina]MBR9653584.1 hypothetical protein [Thalassovita aquimarina]
MSISVTPFTSENLCYGATWKIDDKQQLAEQVARVALGYSRHIKKILDGINVPIPASAVSSEAGAIDLFTVEGTDPSHRDGWLFQTISYIAAIRQDPNGIYDSPHMQHAAKGFDGLKLVVDQHSGSIASVVIFEDKATTNPRPTIATKKDAKGKGVAVWDEFRDIEAGNRQPLLTDKISSLLQTVPGVDIDQAIENIIWHETRGYRVSITVGATHSTEDGRKRLFKGYDEVVDGNLNRRQAETLHLENLRDWLSDLAERAKSEVIKACNDV